MAISIRKDTSQYISGSDALQASMFPEHGLLETTEQIRRFELLRLAFFVLKLRKLNNVLLMVKRAWKAHKSRKMNKAFTATFYIMLSFSRC